MGNNKQSNKLLLYAGGAVAVLISIMLMGLEAKSALLDSSGCVLRYSKDANSDTSKINTSKESFSNSIKVKADGNYVECSFNDSSCSTKAKYGEWLKTSITLKKDQEIQLNTAGKVSLCKSKMDGVELEVPRIDDIYVPKKNAEGEIIEKQEIIDIKTDFYSYGLPLSVDANKTDWTDLINVGYLDQVKLIVRLSPNSIPGNRGYTTDTRNIKTLDIFNTKNLDSAQFSTTDCSQGSRDYDAKCSRFTPYRISSVATKCRSDELLEKCTRDNGEDNPIEILKCAKRYKDQLEFGSAIICFPTLIIPVLGFNAGQSTCLIKRIRVNFDTEEKHPGKGIKKIFITSIDSSSSLPLGYSDKEKYNKESFASLDEVNNYILTNFSNSCQNADDHFNGNLDDIKFWFINSNGLAFKNTLDNNVTLAKSDFKNSGAATYGESYSTEINLPLDCQNVDCMRKLNAVGKLQYKFPDFARDARGGYLLGLKHTACVRKNGIGFEGGQGFSNRGQLQYIVADVKDVITADSVGIDVPISLDTNGGSRASIKSDKGGVLYLRINNKKEDYPYSLGSYDVSVVVNRDIEQLEDKFNKFVINMKVKISDTAVQIIKNMTCYEASDRGVCHNFFTYIKLILTLYVTFIGYKLMIVGSISVPDFIFSLLKVTIIAGLINENTFNLFINFINPMIWQFSDIMCANLTGFENKIITVSDGKITTTMLSGPILLFNKILSDLFFGKVMIAQMFATLSAGLMGIFYFIMVVIAMLIFVLAAFRVMCQYIFSFFMVGILLIMSPIFLTFILFSQTYYLFTKWLNQLLTVIFFPIILVAGMGVLVQIFQMYLDVTLGYSVCWKCSIYFKLPFADATSKITGKFATIPLFCLYWYAPWGVDTASDNITFSIANIVGLFMISYCCNKYIDVAAQATQSIFGGGINTNEKAMIEFLTPKKR